MALNQAYEQYNRNKILTASPAELTLFLYEGAIKFCNIAIMAIDQNDIQKAHINIKKVEDIIVEFRSTLNHKYQVSKDFDKIYEYIYDLLVEANIKKDKQLLEEALKQLRGMRDTWKEVMVKTRAADNAPKEFMA
jgi:flagellar protein FliS